MLKVYIDASTKGNPGPSGAGILITGEGIHQQIGLPLSVLSNHEAEFETLILALNYLIEHHQNEQTILLHSDSKTVVSTIDKNHTKNPTFAPYLEQFQALETFFPLLIVQWIPESQNKGADKLARQGLQKSLNKRDQV